MDANIIAFLGGAAIVWYFFCLLCLGLELPFVLGEKRAELRRFMGVSITTIAGGLAAFVGMTLGFSTTVKAANERIETAASALSNLEILTPDALPDGISINKLKSPLTTNQVIASWSYVASIFLAVVLYVYRGDVIDPIVLNLAKSFLGLIGGLLAVVLNVS